MTTRPSPIAALPAARPTQIAALKPADPALIPASVRGLPPGIYLTADLYRYYQELSAEAGTYPVYVASYGKRLRELGVRGCHDTTGTRRCRVITADLDL